MQKATDQIANRGSQRLYERVCGSVCQIVSIQIQIQFHYVRKCSVVLDCVQCVRKSRNPSLFDTNIARQFPSTSNFFIHSLRGSEIRELYLFTYLLFFLFLFFLGLKFQVKAVNTIINILQLKLVSSNYVGKIT